MKRINLYKKYHGIFIPEAIIKIPVNQLSHGAKICYGRLARFMGKKMFCFPGIGKLASEMGVKKRAVDNYIKELKDFGLIETKRRGLGQSNLYYFLDHEVLRDALTNALINADKDVAKVQDDVEHKESQDKESNFKESSAVYNPSGLVVKKEEGEDLISKQSELGAKDKLEHDIKEIISAYRSKVSKSYPPQITSETTGLIKLGLKHFTKEQILEGIDRYSKHGWWMEKTAQYGINWYFEYSHEFNMPSWLEDWLYLEERIWESNS